MVARIAVEERELREDGDVARAGRVPDVAITRRAIFFDDCAQRQRRRAVESKPDFGGFAIKQRTPQVFHSSDEAIQDTAIALVDLDAPPISNRCTPPI